MGGGGKSKTNYKNPIEISSMVQWIGIAAVRGYSGLNSPDGMDLDLSKFMQTVSLEVEKSDQSNIGHPLYKPFIVRRYGAGVGLAEEHNLAYDNVNTMYWSWCQLSEGMRVIAAGKIPTMDDYTINVGDTIAVEDQSLGVRRLLLVEGVAEDANGVELAVIDVLGG